jgi:RNA polymerase sigma factor FliA
MVDAPPPKKPPPDSPEVLARLAEGMDLVDLLARQLRRQFGPRVSYDDLGSQGREALLAAARSFDPDRGVPFRRWANLRGAAP